MERDPLAEFMGKHPVFADALREHPLGDLTKDYPREEVASILAAMVQWASDFSESELGDLGSVVRLTVEFVYFLRRWDMGSVDTHTLEYVGDSILWGVDSFLSVCHAYRVLVGQTRSTLPERVISRAALKDEFMAMYNIFAVETNYEKKCRLLLDLFKLQIVFAGLTYDR